MVHKHMCASQGNATEIHLCRDLFVPVLQDCWPPFVPMFNIQEKNIKWTCRRYQNVGATGRVGLSISPRYASVTYKMCFFLCLIALARFFPSKYYNSVRIYDTHTQTHTFTIHMYTITFMPFHKILCTHFVDVIVVGYHEIYTRIIFYLACYVYKFIDVCISTSRALISLSLYLLLFDSNISWMSPTTNI